MDNHNSLDHKSLASISGKQAQNKLSARMIGNKPKYYALLCAALYIFLPSVSAEAQSPNEEIDAIFARFDTTRTPGCAVAVTRDGQFLFAKGYGMANLELGAPITEDTVFRIASVSKQFTATSIAILAERGDIDLDADIHTYLPDLVEYGQPVTVRQMVHHISGMGDYNGFEVRPGTPFRFGDEDYWTTDEFLDAVNSKQLEYNPGEAFHYSNLGYFLLGQLVERVSDQSLREFAQAEIFLPLGMTSTLFYDNVREIIASRAQGYREIEGGSYQIAMTNLDWVGDGGVHTNLVDMARWDRALAEGDLPGGAEFVARMHTAHPLTIREPDTPSGATTGYGFGISITSSSDETRISHSGGWTGANAFYSRVIDDDFGVIMLCNREDGLAEGRDEQLIAAARKLARPD